MTLLNDKFTYSASPKSIKPPKKAKYRGDDEPGKISGNILSDSRVTSRNSTTRETTDMKSKATLRGIMSRGVEEKSMPYYEFRYRCVPGDNFNLDSFLIERESFNKVNLINQNAQTDVFADKPPTPRYVPRKTGVDQSTQVEDTAELFDFDAEVAPIVQTLVSKTIEQSIFEVSCEEELKELELVQQRCLDIKSEHDAWVQDELQRTITERAGKEAVIKESEVKHAQMLKLRTLIAGQQFMNQIYSHSIDNICRELTASEIWKDSNKEMVKNELLPELLERAGKAEDYLKSSRIIIDGKIQLSAAHREEFEPYSRKFILDILQEAASRYNDRPPYHAPEESIQAIFTITQDQDSQHDDADDNEDSEKRDVQSVLSEIIVGPISIDRKTTIQELTKTVNVSSLVC
jgi:hypothetical protein